MNLTRTGCAGRPLRHARSENLVAWLATKTDKTATCRLTTIDWQTIERVGEEPRATRGAASRAPGAGCEDQHGVTTRPGRRWERSR